MAYGIAEQTPAANEPLQYAAFGVNAPDGSITQAGDTGLTLSAGTYLVTFTADVALAGTGGTAVGAALALDGTIVPYAQSVTDTTDTTPQRIAVNTIVTVAGPAQTLTVVNNTDNTITYSNASLTVVKLA